MIYDLLNSYGKYFKDNKIVLDNYTLEEGIYVRIGEDGSIKDILEVTKDNAEGLKESESYEFFKERDIYSKYINSNKAISTDVKDIKEYKTGKKFFSSNYLTLFFKNDILEALTEKAAEEKKDEEKSSILPLDIFKQVINKYYESILMLGTEKKEDKFLIEQFDFPEINEDEILGVKEIYISNIEKIIEKLKEINMKKGTRIKLFYDADIPKYIDSSIKYTYLKIFNSNSTNVMVDINLYGMNNYNFGMNSKKPYMELKSTPFKVGSRLPMEKIIMARNLYTWMIKNWGYKKEKMPIDYDFIKTIDPSLMDEFYIINSINNNGEAVVENFEYISKSTNLIKEFRYVNFINKYDIDEEKINKLDLLENKINKEIFSSCLCKSYTNKSEINKLTIEKYKKNLIYIYIDLFYDFFRKYNSAPLKQKISKISDIICRESLITEMTSSNFSKYKMLKDTTKKVVLCIQLEEYLNDKGGESMENKIQRLKREAKEIINKDNYIENDEQFFFMVGQVAYYLLTQSKADKLKQSVVEPILQASSLEKLKKELEFLYKRYKNEIYLKSHKFNKAYTEVLAYETSEKIKSNTRLIVIGMLSDSIFYEKKEELVGGNENGENE